MECGQTVTFPLAHLPVTQSFLPERAWAGPEERNKGRNGKRGGGTACAAAPPALRLGIACIPSGKLPPAQRPADSSPNQVCKSHSQRIEKSRQQRARVLRTFWVLDTGNLLWAHLSLKEWLSSWPGDPRSAVGHMCAKHISLLGILTAV